MDLQMLEMAANVVFEMCRQHPEICPHNYHWVGTSAPDEEGKCIELYRCDLCGSEYRRTIEKDK